MTTNSSPKNFWQRLLARFVLYFLIFMTTSSIAVPYVRLLWQQQVLNQAKQRWLTTRPATYQVTVYSHNFVQNAGTCDFGEPYVVTVTNGNVVDSNAPVECKVIYEQLTVENSFVKIEQYLKNANFILTTTPSIKYDAAYNFISYFYISHTDSIFSTDYSPTSISYENFRVLETSSTSESPKP